MAASNMKGNRRLLISHIWTFISSFLLAAILPKVLDVSDYILVMQLTAIVGLFVPLCTFAAPTYLIRQYKVIKGYYLINIVAKLFILGLTLSIIILTPINFLYMEHYSEVSIHIFLIAIISLMAVLSILSGVSRMQSNALLYFHSIATSKILTVVFLIVISLFFSVSKNTYIYLWFSALMITVVLLFRRARESINVLLENNEVNDNVVHSFRDSFFFCYPIVISNALVVALPFIERMKMPLVISNEDVALYIFNIDVIGKISAVSLLVLKVVIFPHILKFDIKEQIIQYHLYLKKLVTFLIMVCIASYIIVFSFLNRVYESLGYGDFFNADVICMVITSFCLIAVNYMFTIALAIVKKNEILILTTVITLTLHYIGIDYLGVRFGVVGISFSYLFSIGVVTIILGLFSNGSLNAYKKNIS
ncbi:hypothetical protein M8475_002545 [Vibrio parahaemolyticus]|nr:hypothetical protein [Vibrio parahaemolyticus]